MNTPHISSPAAGITSTATINNQRSSTMSSSKKVAFISVFTSLLCLMVIALPHAALADDASADFSTSNDPNGAWSYGWSTTLGSAFTLDASNTTAAYGLTGLGGWFAGVSPEGVPSVL